MQRKIMVLIVIIIALIIAAFAGASAVFADCSNNNPANSETVTCTSAGGTETDQIGNGTQNNVTVNVENGTTLAPDQSNGQYNGIILNTDANVTNNGTIQNADSDAIQVTDNSTVVNNGTLTGNGDDGIQVNSGNNVTNNGSITENEYGVYLEGDNNTVTNNVSIDNNANEGILVNGVDQTIENNGTINGNQEGIRATTTNFNLTNNGEINNNADTGIIAGANSNVTNNGTIAGNNGGGTQIGFGSYGSDQQNNFTQTQNGSVRAAKDTTIAIRMGGQDDTAVIDIRSEIVGVIDGGTEFDSLTFTLSSTDPAELEAFNTFMASVSVTDNTLTYNGRTFNWRNFEELAAFVEQLVAEVASGGGAGSSTNATSSPQAIDCPNVKVFHSADGFVQVYSGFDIYENGFLVGVSSPADALVGSMYNLDDASTPAWSVQIQPGNTLNVLNESGAVMGTCAF